MCLYTHSCRSDWSQDDVKFPIWCPICMLILDLKRWSLLHVHKFSLYLKTPIFFHWPVLIFCFLQFAKLPECHRFHFKPVTPHWTMQEITQLVCKAMVVGRNRFCTTQRVCDDLKPPDRFSSQSHSFTNPPLESKMAIKYQLTYILEVDIAERVSCLAGVGFKAHLSSGLVQAIFFLHPSALGDLYA